MLRTLFICHSYLSGNGGGIYASRTHINLFSEVSDEMTLLYPYKKGKEPEGIYEEKIKMIPIEDTRTRFNKAVDLCFGKVHRYIHIAKQFIKPEYYDLVVFDNSVVSSSLIKHFKKVGIKTITIHHNYQIEYLLGDSSLMTLLPNLLWTWIYEKQAVKYSSLNITLTQQDADLLASHYDRYAKFQVLGVFEYQRRNFQIIKNRDRGSKYIITGNLQDKQTANSLISWIKKYYPVLRKSDPNVHLTIAGREPSKKLFQIAVDNGIELIASPQNMELILKEQDYYICPTDRGGGLKLRIMDGIKSGLPILTHCVSARGYEKMLDEGVLFMYDDIESFKKGIKSLQTIRKTHTDIQHKYIQMFDFNSGIEKLKNILKKEGVYM